MMLKIIISLLLMFIIFWSIYSMYIKLDDRNGILRLIADIYWYIIVFIIMFMFCYGVVNKLM